MSNFKQFGKLPGRPSELIRYCVKHGMNGAIIINRGPEQQAGLAMEAFQIGEIHVGFVALELDIPKELKSRVHLEKGSRSVFKSEMLDMARQLEERGY